MFTHYLTTALRNFWRHRVSATINVMGLALGLICFIVAFGYALIITNGDRGFANADRIQFVMTRISITAGEFARTINTLSTPWPLAPHLVSAFPEFETIARAQNAGPTGVRAEGKNAFFAAVYADPAFLRIFDLPFVAGDAQHALDRPKSVVISEAAAQRLFGTNAAVGRTMTVRGLDLTVSGVIGTISGPSHLLSITKFDLLISMDVMEEAARKTTGANSTYENMQKWDYQSFFTYILLPSSNGDSRSDLNRRLVGFSAATVPKNNAPLLFTARPISEVSVAGMDTLVTRGDQTGIPSNVLLIILGSLIAGITCLNYSNLTAAQTLGRIKEAGLRLAIGARRGQLLAQHMLETTLHVAAAMLIAVSVLLLLSPSIDAYVGFSILNFVSGFREFWLALLGVAAVVAIAAGSYPAVLMSRVLPGLARQKSESANGRNYGARILVGVQFGIVAFLIVLSLVVAGENRELKNAGLRSSEDPVVVIANDMRDAGVSVDQLRTELTRSTHVKGVTASLLPPWGFSMSTGLFQRGPDAAAGVLASNQHWVGADFFQTLDIPILAGRAFSAERDESLSNLSKDSDKRDPINVIVDRAFAAQFGWTPEQAVGQTVYGTTGDSRKPGEPAVIVGVAENKALKLMSPVAQVNAYYFDEVNAGIPLIRVDANNVAAATTVIDEAWARLAPNVPMKRQFMDDLFHDTYKIFGAISSVILSVASFAFVIAIIGLVGMATYATARQKKEIGIRKALGSSARQALTLILWSFSKPVVIANVVAWPVAFIAARTYLSLFVTQIPLTPLPFVLALLISLAVTWIAVGWQAYAAARVNPADVLHYE